MNKEEFIKKSDLIGDSKLSLYLDKKLNFYFEIKNLTKHSIYFFLYVILDNLKKENIIDKNFLILMINEIL